jgi:hypothetical protein
MAITQKSLEELWLKALMAVLFGYALFGKEFAYFFPGEMLLLVGCVIFIRSQRFGLILSDPTLFLWGLFAFWGLCRTIPFIGKWGFFAIRDAALWGYGLAALLVVAFVNNSNQISRALSSYRRFVAWLAPAIFVMLVLGFAFEFRPPAPPWASESTFPLIKGGDAAVQLAGAALITLMFAPRRRASGRQDVSPFRVMGYITWVASTLIMLIIMRAGFVAIVVPIALMSALRFQRVGWKVVAAGMVVVVLMAALLASDLLNFTMRGRQVTSDQMAASVTSIFGNSQHGELEGTKEWRLGWWKNIVDYTVFGPYFWTGKGFGVNLAVEDGPPGLTAEETSLRSPHNGSMTVLARMGVPGVLLWLAMNLSFVFRITAAYRLANRAGLRFWANVNLWIFCFWLAAMINLSFDVYLEGPQGAFWFWSIIGLGVAGLRVQAHERRRLRARVAEVEQLQQYA